MVLGIKQLRASRKLLFLLTCISFEIQWIYYEVVMATTNMIHVRVDDTLKDEATQALAAMGLSVSDAVRLFLKRVVIEQALPFELKVPNAETRAAIEESRAMGRARFANAQELFDDLEKADKR
jgi:DNA-damage-inducible protein J